MTEDAALCKMCKKPSAEMNANRFCPPCQKVLEQAIAEGKHIDRLENFQPSAKMQAFLDHKGAGYKLPCGCVVPPGCSCPSAAAEAAHVAVVLMEATGLTLLELEALRTKYLASGDFLGLTKKLDELAHARGKVLLISKGE